MHNCTYYIADHKRGLYRRSQLSVPTETNALVF
jgi:hypothetical protein